MDRPNTAMTATVNAGLAMANRHEAIAHLIAKRVPDHVIARLLCERADTARRRVELPYPTSETFRVLVRLSHSHNEVERGVYNEIAAGFSAEFKAQIEAAAKSTVTRAAAPPDLE